MTDTAGYPPPAEGTEPEAPKPTHALVDGNGKVVELIVWHGDPKHFADGTTAYPIGEQACAVGDSYVNGLFKAAEPPAETPPPATEPPPA